MASSGSALRIGAGEGQGRGGLAKSINRIIVRYVAGWGERKRTGAVAVGRNAAKCAGVQGAPFKVSMRGDVNGTSAATPESSAAWSEAPCTNLSAAAQCPAQNSPVAWVAQGQVPAEKGGQGVNCKRSFWQRQGRRGPAHGNTSLHRQAANETTNVCRSAYR